MSTTIPSLTPTSNLVCPLLTDMYQVSMAYAYWSTGKHCDHAVFDLFFRKNPFDGRYCIFAGLDEVLKFVANFRFTDSDVGYLRSVMTNCDTAFFDWLLTLDCSEVRLFAMKEGSVVFPKEPLIRVEGPLAVTQLLETTLLNLINFPSLIATNASRMRLAVGPHKNLLEFGLRRAQGPDGGLSASKYSYLGGFNGTSNVLAGKLFGIKISGTHAHSFVMSYTQLSDLTRSTITDAQGNEVEFVSLVLQRRVELNYTKTNDGELAAYIAYAQSFPRGFLALVDTYDTLSSGVPNFLVVGAALHDVGYKPLGVRLDSGDLSVLSKAVRSAFRKCDADHMHGEDFFSSCFIVASNDINEELLDELNANGHEIDTFGIGTHLVTCQRQPALGCVYKLVEINGHARIKLSNEVTKIIIPGSKNCYRLYDEHDKPLVDLLTLSSEPMPSLESDLTVYSPFKIDEHEGVAAKRIKQLLLIVFDGKHGIVHENIRSIHEARDICALELASLGDPAAVRASVDSTGIHHKLSVSRELCQFSQQLLEQYSFSNYH